MQDMLRNDKCCPPSSVLQNALLRQRLPVKIRVFRGIKSYNSAPEVRAQFDNLKVGDKIMDKGFMSTTLSEHNTNSFMPEGGPGKECCTMVINLPKGFPTFWISALDIEESRFHEDEILLPKNTILKLTKEKIVFGNRRELTFDAIAPLK